MFVPKVFAVSTVWMAEPPGHGVVVGPTTQAFAAAFVELVAPNAPVPSGQRPQVSAAWAVQL